MRQLAANNDWFEVKEPIEYHEYDLGPRKPDETDFMLVRCARELRKHFPALPKSIEPALVDPAN